jgi:hypothetical protein
VGKSHQPRKDDMKEKFVLDRVGFAWASGSADKFHLRQMDDPGQEYGTNSKVLCDMPIFHNDIRIRLIRDGKISFGKNLGKNLCEDCKKKVIEQVNKGKQVVLVGPATKKVPSSQLPLFTENVSSLPLGFAAVKNSMPDKTEIR